MQVWLPVTLRKHFTTILRVLAWKSEGLGTPPSQVQPQLWGLPGVSGTWWRTSEAPAQAPESCTLTETLLPSSPIQADLEFLSQVQTVGKWQGLCFFSSLSASWLSLQWLSICWLPTEFFHLVSSAWLRGNSFKDLAQLEPKSKILVVSWLPLCFQNTLVRIDGCWVKGLLSNFLNFWFEWILELQKSCKEEKIVCFCASPSFH